MKFINIHHVPSNTVLQMDSLITMPRTHEEFATLSRSNITHSEIAARVFVQQAAYHSACQLLFSEAFGVQVGERVVIVALASSIASLVYLCPLVASRAGVPRLGWVHFARHIIIWLITTAASAGRIKIPQITYPVLETYHSTYVQHINNQILQTIDFICRAPNM
jgi:hypothetical protein